MFAVPPTLRGEEEKEGGGAGEEVGGGLAGLVDSEEGSQTALNRKHHSLSNHLAKLT
jgi:hypothetical protein